MSKFETVARSIVEAMNHGPQLRHEEAPFHQCGNVFIKVMELPLVGSSVIQHAHQYDHVTIIGKGSVKLIVGDVEAIYTAPAFIDIKARTHHALIALEDDTLAFCVHDVAMLDIDALGEPYLKGN